MKKTFKSLVAVFIAALLLTMSVAPVMAEQPVKSIVITVDLTQKAWADVVKAAEDNLKTNGYSDGDVAIISGKLAWTKDISDKLSHVSLTEVGTITAVISDLVDAAISDSGLNIPPIVVSSVKDAMFNTYVSKRSELKQEIVDSAKKNFNKADVLKYYDENVSTIFPLIQSNIPMVYRGFVTKDVIRGQLVVYLNKNEENIKNTIASLLDGTESFDAKTVTVQNLLASCLEDMLLSMLSGYGIKTLPNDIKASIKGFAEEYGKQLADDAFAYLGSTVSEGDNLFLVISIVEAAVIVALIVLAVVLKKKTAK